MTGDDVSAGDHPEAKPLYDIDAIHLLRIARIMRDEGQYLSGRPLAQPPTFLIGAVENPFAPPLEFRPMRLGKKVEAFEVKMASVAILLPPLVVLVGAAIGALAEGGKAGVANPGAHGFSEILYAFSSAGNNNGSAFAGLSANTPFYNTALGFAMLISRYWLIIPVLAVAGSFAAKKTVPAGPGTLPTHTPLFVVLIIGTLGLVGALTFVPALALGPIVEHFQMLSLK